jgi:hypothetical protein
MQTVERTLDGVLVESDVGGYLAAPERRCIAREEETGQLDIGLG